MGNDCCGVKVLSFVRAIIRNEKLFFEELNKILPFLPQGFVTSAEKGTGVEDVLACIDQYNKLDAEGL